jgi:spermidine synthase
MILYQSLYGNLYSEIALLLLALYAGFVSGSRIRRLPHSDLWLGVYALATFFLLTLVSHPPVILFVMCHMGIGILGAGQFVVQEKTSPSMLYAADLLGGVFGMALSSTVLIPVLGIVPVALGLCALKVAIEGVYLFFIRAG